MQISLDQFALDCANYRLVHGELSLYPYYCRTSGKMYVVKRNADQSAVLAEAFGTGELQITKPALALQYSLWTHGKSGLPARNKAQQAAAHSQLYRVIKAIQRVLYTPPVTPPIRQNHSRRLPPGNEYIARCRLANFAIKNPDTLYV